MHGYILNHVGIIYNNLLLNTGHCYNVQSTTGFRYKYTAVVVGLYRLKLQKMFDGMNF